MPDPASGLPAIPDCALAGRASGLNQTGPDSAVIGAEQNRANLIPIGVFDSGIGGLSVLRHIRTLLPHEFLLYFADSGFAPYGDKPESFVIERSLTIAKFFIHRGIKALVVPCNTATAAAIKALRETYPALPVVGVEPGLKPAAALSQTGIVGVLATSRTLASEKFQLLQDRVSADTGVRFILQACVGLADRVENGDLHSPGVEQMVRHFVTPLIEQGADTLVLGCTHYPFVRDLIEAAARQSALAPVSIVDTGEAVARQLARLLQEHRLQRAASGDGALEAFTSGRAKMLADAFSGLLQLHPAITEINEYPAPDCSS